MEYEYYTFSTIPFENIVNNDDETIIKIAELLKCCICHDISLYDARTCSANDQHVVCNNCFYHDDFDDDVCPLCRRNVTFKQGTSFIKTLLELLKATCPFCKGIVNLSNMRRHLSDRCSHRLYTCVCNKYFSYHNFVKHLKTCSSHLLSNLVVHKSTKRCTTIHCDRDECWLLLLNQITNVGIIFVKNSDHIYASYISINPLSEFYCKVQLKHNNMTHEWSGPIKRFSPQEDYNIGSTLILQMIDDIPFKFNIKVQYDFTEQSSK